MQTDVYFKKTVQTKMKILSFIHPHVVSALYKVPQKKESHTV